MDFEGWKYRLKDHWDMQFCYARAKGGYSFHTVDLKTGISLCGHEPKKGLYSTHSNRAGWVFMLEKPTYARFCDKCHPKPTVKRIKRTRPCQQ